MFTDHSDEDDPDEQWFRTWRTRPSTLNPLARPFISQHLRVPDGEATIRPDPPDARPDEVSRPPRADSQASTNPTIIVTPSTEPSTSPPTSPQPTLPAGPEILLTTPPTRRPAFTVHPSGSDSGRSESVSSTLSTDSTLIESPPPSYAQLPAIRRVIGTDTQNIVSASTQGPPQPRDQRTIERSREHERLRQLHLRSVIDLFAGLRVEINPTPAEAAAERDVFVPGLRPELGLPHLHRPRESTGQRSRPSSPPPYHPDITVRRLPWSARPNIVEPGSNAQPSAANNPSSSSPSPPSAANTSRRRIQTDLSIQDPAELHTTRREEWRRLTEQVSRDLVQITRQTEAIGERARHGTCGPEDRIEMDNLGARLDQFPWWTVAPSSSGTSMPPASQTRHSRSTSQGQLHSPPNRSMSSDLSYTQLCLWVRQNEMNGLHNPVVAARTQLARREWTASQLNLGDPARRNARRMHYASVREANERASQPVSAEAPQVEPRPLDRAAAMRWDQVRQVIEDRSFRARTRGRGVQTSSGQPSTAASTAGSYSGDAQSPGGRDVDTSDSPETFLQRLKFDKALKDLRAEQASTRLVQKPSVKQSAESALPPPPSEVARRLILKRQQPGLRRSARRLGTLTLTRQRGDQHVLRMLSRLTDQRMLLPIVLLHPRMAFMIAVIVALVLGLYLLGMMLLLQARGAGSTEQVENEDD